MTLCIQLKYVNVLDFVSNDKKANLAPFLLRGRDYSTTECIRNT